MLTNWCFISSKYGLKLHSNSSWLKLKVNIWLISMFKRVCVCSIRSVHFLCITFVIYKNRSSYSSRNLHVSSMSVLRRVFRQSSSLGVFVDFWHFWHLIIVYIGNFLIRSENWLLLQPDERVLTLLVFNCQTCKIYSN